MANLRPFTLQPNRGSQRPLWPLAVNRDSAQAGELAAWCPFQPAGTSYATELAQGVPGEFIGANWASDSEGIIGGLFGGGTTGSYVGVRNNEAQNPTAAITVAAWVKVAGGTNAFRTVISKPSGAGWSNPFARYCLRLEGTGTTFLDNGICFFVETGAALGNIVGGNTPVLPSSHLRHLVGTYDGVTLKTYLDGRLDGTKSLVTSITPSTQPLAIGTRNVTSVDESWNGQIFDARVYGRALSETEVWQLFDPKTRWDLYQPLRQRAFSFPLVPAQTFNPSWTNRGVVIGGGCH